MERNYSDEQILEEARNIMQNPQLRYCKTCHHWCDRHCQKLDKDVPSFQYAGMCKYYETNEEKILREAREAIARLEHEERKLNHLLTLSLNSIETAMLFLEDFSGRIEKEYRRAGCRREPVQAAVEAPVPKFADQTTRQNSCQVPFRGFSASSGS